jgi:DNA-3-methyladenine glycosylase II
MDSFFYLPQPSQFDFQACLWFLDRNYDECLQKIGPGNLRKAARLGGRSVLFELSEKENRLQIQLLAGEVAPELLLDFVEKWFDLRRDLSIFYDLLAQDPDFMPLKLYAGLRLLGIPDVFEGLAWSIIGQQINLTFAYRLKRRLVEHVGAQVTFEGQSNWLFPTPEQVADLTVSTLRDFQFSERKAEYLIHLGQLFAEGTLSQSLLESMPTAEARTLLVAQRGIGLWSANYALMKALKRPDCIPYGDTGIYSALNRYKNLPRRASKAEIDEAYGAFVGWESYLTTYLWRGISEK